MTSSTLSSTSWWQRIRLVGDNCNGNTMKVKKVIWTSYPQFYSRKLRAWYRSLRMFLSFQSVTHFMDKNSKIRRFFMLVVSMAHVPPNRLKDGTTLLDSNTTIAKVYTCHLCQFRLTRRSKRKRCYCRRLVHISCFDGDGSS